MKNLILLAATLFVLTACGKKGDEPVVTTAAATTPQTCQAGYVWNGSSCVIQNGYPQPGQPYQPGTPGYQPMYPSYPQMCGGGYSQYPGQYSYCSNWSRYRWYSYNGFIFYYYVY